jgi:hypothetical protein
MAMNVVVTLHQPVCLYSAAGEEGEPPYRLHWLSGGSPEARNFLIVYRQRAQGRCFSDLQHSEAFVFFVDQARCEKRSSTAKGLLLGVFFSTEGPQGKNTFDKNDTKACRSYLQPRLSSSRRSSIALATVQDAEGQ